MSSLGRIFLSILAGGDSVPLGRITFFVASALALPLATFEVWYALGGTASPILLGLVFVCPLLIIAFLSTSGVNKRHRIGWFEILMSLLIFVSGLYLIYNSARYDNWILGLSKFNVADTVAGAVLMVGAVTILKRCVGLGMTSVVMLLVSYQLFGHLFSGFFYHREFSIFEVIEQSVISVNGGLFGAPVNAAAVYVYLFVVFGKVLQVSGGGQFFYDIAAAFAGRRQGGVAKVAVVSSGLFGMISGSPTSDVVTTGTITIPTMKKVGYPAHIAAAIETVACVGGSIMPPVMGAVVFLMVEFTGISYGTIVQTSIILAALYYLAIFTQVHQFSAQRGIGSLPDDEIPYARDVLKTGWVYILPLALLVIMIEQNYTPQLSVTLSIVLTIILSWLHKDQHCRIGPKKLFILITEASVMLAPLVAAVAGAGLVEQVLNVTGIGSKISFEMFAVANGNDILIMIFAALVTVIFGMGMPVPAVYALAAILLAPGMIQAGFSVLSAHLFLVWFSVASHLTPPIAVAAYVASAIAQSKPMLTSLWASRLGILAFMLPFAFMLRPGLLLEGGSMQVASDTFLVVLALMQLVGTSIGYFGARVATWARWFLLITGLVTMYGAAWPVVSWAAGLGGLSVLIFNYRFGVRFVASRSHHSTFGGAE